MTAGPLPPGAGEPLATGAGEPRAANRIASTRPGVGLRLLDRLAGLLSAGVLVVGVILLLAALIAPAAVAAAGLGVADGPGWDRVITHMVVGVAGELVVLLRSRWPTVVRALADTIVVVAALMVFWWAWLP